MPRTTATGRGTVSGNETGSIIGTTTIMNEIVSVTATATEIAIVTETIVIETIETATVSVTAIVIETATIETIEIGITEVRRGTSEMIVIGDIAQIDTDEILWMWTDTNWTMRMSGLGK
jgi:hypothetical protein